MAWPHYKPWVTVVDVLETNACYDGVIDWIKVHAGQIAGETATQETNQYILAAANGSGYGDGSGSGDGSGDGSGYGSG